MKLKISNKNFIAEGILQIDFSLKGIDFSFQPGQFVKVDFINGPETLLKMPRYFSIISSPNDKNKLSIVTFIRESSDFKRMLRDIEVGMKMEVSQPFGNFTLPKDDKVKSLVFIAGGIGITPFISMLRYIVEKKLPFMVAIIYSIRTINCAPFLNELETYEKSDFKLMKIITVTCDENFNGTKGRINSDLIQNNITNLSNCLFYVAGSVEFVKTIKSILSDLKIDSNKIKTDGFSGI